MLRVRSTQVPPKGREEVSEKRKVKYLYVEADEEHIALQFKEKKGDIKRFKGHADSGQIIKLVYVHEGYAILVYEEFRCPYYKNNGRGCDHLISS